MYGVVSIWFVIFIILLVMVVVFGVGRFVERFLEDRVGWWCDIASFLVRIVCVVFVGIFSFMMVYDYGVRQGYNYLLRKHGFHSEPQPFDVYVKGKIDVEGISLDEVEMYVPVELLDSLPRELEFFGIVLEDSTQQ